MRFLLLLAIAAYAQDDDDDDDELLVEPMMAPPAPSMRVEFEAMDLDGLYATPGGAQDIGQFRDLVKRGEIPPLASLTSSGLFAEHDLPLPPGPKCDRMVCPVAEAVETGLAGRSDVQWVAQLGFDSGMDPAKFHRPPLALVAVVDRSCSMEGEPFETVRASLDQVAKQLGPDDRLAIVTYGSDVTTVLPPTAGGQPAIDAAIRKIAIDGSTNLEAGLTRGYEVAADMRRSFDGTTRVMLFTDEQPNTGRTDATSFMGMAEDGSKHGVGLTTIGVGTAFGAELATQVSSVRGGNLFFFPNPSEMKERFAEELDTMVVELAYDFDLVVTPAEGAKIVDVYGVPADAFERRPDGSWRIAIATLFVSHEAGGIVFALGRDPAHPDARVGSEVASIALAYTPRDGGATTSTVAVSSVSGEKASTGLVRSRWLVEEYAALEAALTAHDRGDGAGAYVAIHGFADRLRNARDPELESEKDLVFALEKLLQPSAPRTAANP
jgi:Ca-activated chloride channel family protein